MNIDYDHAQNMHTQRGPAAALPVIFGSAIPKSILDVGCGTGTWLKAALNLGITDVYGIDGVEIPPEQLLFDNRLFKRCDLTTNVNLGRRFDLALCLEVAEHLDEEFASVLVQTLVNHADQIVFSGACPGQPGQHHVNCQWPSYWQRVFNQRGYVCDDNLRWKIWDDIRIEPWYRQNLFAAKKDPKFAGAEPRIKSVLHPDLQQLIFALRNDFEHHVTQIEEGRMKAQWYFRTPARALIEKIKRRLA